MQKSSPLTRLFHVMLCALWLYMGAALFSWPAFATEGGGGVYPNGAEDFMSGALPPPGTYFLDYANFYHRIVLQGSRRQRPCPGV
jgi:hypothetical protein